jgi:hypothetical protein
MPAQELADAASVRAPNRQQFPASTPGARSFQEQGRNNARRLTSSLQNTSLVTTQPSAKEDLT